MPNLDRDALTDAGRRSGTQRKESVAYDIPQWNDTLANEEAQGGHLSTAKPVGADEPRDLKIQGGDRR